jgi:hypothetical protein
MYITIYLILCIIVIICYTILKIHYYQHKQQISSKIIIDDDLLKYNYNIKYYNLI